MGGEGRRRSDDGGGVLGYWGIEELLGLFCVGTACSWKCTTESSCRSPAALRCLAAHKASLTQ